MTVLTGFLFRPEVTGHVCIGPDLDSQAQLAVLTWTSLVLVYMLVLVSSSVSLLHRNYCPVLEMCLIMEVLVRSPKLNHFQKWNRTASEVNQTHLKYLFKVLCDGALFTSKL